MELWRLRAREFLSARSTHDSCEDESLDEALSSPNSAPMNWGYGDRGETTLSERGWGTEDKPLTCPLFSVCHLFFLRRNFGFDGQDEIRCGISQLAKVLIDVAFPLQPHVVVHVPGSRVGRERCVGGGEEKRKLKAVAAVDALRHFYPIQRSKQKLEHSDK